MNCRLVGQYTELFLLIRSDITFRLFLNKMCSSHRGRTPPYKLVSYPLDTVSSYLIPLDCIAFVVVNRNMFLLHLNSLSFTINLDSLERSP